MESVQKVVTPEKTVATQFKRREKALLHVEVKRSQRDAQERRGGAPDAAAIPTHQLSQQAAGEC